MPLRIAVLNDYSIDDAMRLHAQGTYPAQHTWGVSLFEAQGVQPLIVPYKGSGLWHSLRAQIRVWLTQHRVDVVYAACQSETWLLSRLRALGLFWRPVVAVIHHPLAGRLRGGPLVVRGHDRLLFLSERVREATAQAYPDRAARFHTLPWGVDTAFYDQPRGSTRDFGQNYFVSAGKANRDHDTLAACASAGQHRTVIICSAQTAPANSDEAWVTVVSDQTGHAVSYGELTSIYRAARAVVIPLTDVSLLAGLTSLLDAIACGRPVIMTRNAFVDIDIEALGLGIWVPPGDQAALLAAMDRLAQDDALVQRMSEKARAFALEGYAYETFAQRVVDHCRAVAA